MLNACVDEEENLAVSELAAVKTESGMAVGSGPCWRHCTAMEVGLRSSSGAVPAWLTVAVCPAMVSVPARAAGEALAVAENCTTPGPVPLKPDAIVRKDDVVEAVHGQPALVRMPTVPVPAAAGNT